MIDIKEIFAAVQIGQIKFYVDAGQLFVSDNITGEQFPLGKERRVFYEEEIKG